MKDNFEDFKKMFVLTKKDNKKSMLIGFLIAVAVIASGVAVYFLKCRKNENGCCEDCLESDFDEANDDDEDFEDFE